MAKIISDARLEQGLWIACVNPDDYKCLDYDGRKALLARRDIDYYTKLVESVSLELVRSQAILRHLYTPLDGYVYLGYGLYTPVEATNLWDGSRVDIAWTVYRHGSSRLGLPDMTSDRTFWYALDSAFNRLYDAVIAAQQSTS